MDKLKSCPFCGNDAELYRSFGRYGTFMYVECLCCGAKTKAFGTGNKDESDADWESNAAMHATWAWNNRKEGGDNG